MATSTRGLMGRYEKRRYFTTNNSISRRSNLLKFDPQLSMIVKKNISAFILVWIIIAFVGSTNGKPMSTASPLDTAQSVTAEGSKGILQPLVVPQVGYLEERSDITTTGKDVTTESKNSANGILVPIVSIADAQNSPAKGASPLVALLPAPPAIPSSTDPAQLPAISNLPILPVYDPRQPAAKPEIGRFLRDASSAAINERSPYYDDSSEMLDVAEDIVFRPLFKIRQNYGKSPTYSSNDYLRRKNVVNYPRYNVNGYYRIPYNYFRYNNNNRYDYDNE